MADVWVLVAHEVVRELENGNTPLHHSIILAVDADAEASTVILDFRDQNRGILMLLDLLHEPVVDPATVIQLMVTLLLKLALLVKSFARRTFRCVLLGLLLLAAGDEAKEPVDHSDSHDPDDDRVDRNRNGTHTTSL